MLHKLLLTVTLVWCVLFQANSQVLTDQCESMTACNALPLCGTNIVNIYSYTTTVASNPIGTCASSTGTFAYNGKWVYYRFTCYSTGTFKFRLVPNDSATVNSDLDWALWDITSSDCSNLNVSNVVECNAAGNGATGVGIGSIPAANFEPNVIMVVGMTYILGISNPSGANTGGFSISFDGTTANIFDNKKPYLSAVLPFDACTPVNQIKVKLSEPVRCDQLGAGTDFTISGVTPAFTVSAGSNCPGCINAAPNNGINFGKLSDTATITFASALAPGTYTISALANAFFDACGKSDSTQATVSFTIPSPMNLSVNSGFSCVFLKYIDTVMVSGGSSPYQYKAVGGGLAASFGTYGTPTASTYSIYTVNGGTPITYTVKDINGCESDIVLSRASVLALGAPNLGISASPPCHDQFNLDSISVIAVSGGIAPYTYTIAPLVAGTIFSSSATFPAIWKNLIFTGPGATYTVTVTDGSGCTKTSVRNLVNPSVLVSPSLIGTNPLCNGDSIGKICFASATGGTPLYNYSISPSYPNTLFTSGSSNCFEHLPAGSFTVTTTDVKGCVSSATKIVSQPSAIVLNALTSQFVKPTCPGICNGAFQPLATGGTGAKKYYRYPYIGPGAWDYSDSVVSSSAPFNKFQNLCAGTYTIICKDAVGCTKTQVITMVPLNSAIQTSSNISACGSYLFNGTTYNSSVTITQTFSLVSGCDSTHTTNITIHPLPLVYALDYTICNTNTVNLIGSPAGGTFSITNPYSGPSTNYTYTYTDVNGCTNTSAPANITVTPCNVALNVNVFIQGYYAGVSTMTPVLLNEQVSTSTTDVDLIKIELRQSTAPYTLVDWKTTMLHTNGTCSSSFNAGPGTYYVVVKHRSGLETWSSNPVSLSSTPSTYDFTTAANKAYGNNMIEMDPGHWAIYSGDVNLDQNIDLIDAGAMINDINSFYFGYYTNDLNGDGNVDLIDLSLLNDNIENFIYSNFP